LSPLEAALLGLLQGITEFLPVSSTAHLVLARWLFGVQGGGLSFDVALHAGTLFSVCSYFHKDLVRVARSFLGSLARPRRIAEDPEARLGWMVLVGTMPGVAFGLLFLEAIEGRLRSPIVIAAALIAVAVLIMAVEALVRPQHKLKDKGVGFALAVGIAQALAMIPGVSRSGATIAGSLALGLEREDAVKFSFLLGIPLILGGCLLKGKHLLENGFGETGATAFVIGTLVSAVSGYLCVAFLMRFVRSRTFTVFMVYRMLLGGLVLYLAIESGLS
jgi:undecaprenyl-diphosphatase